MSVLLRALVTGYIRQNALRSCVTFLAVTLGVAVAYAVGLANATAVASFARSVDVVASTVNLQALGIGTGFDERVLLRAQALDGVEAASPVVEGEAAIGVRRGVGGSGEILRVTGVNITRGVLPPGARDASGASFDLDDFINRRGIFVSERVAREYGLRPGSALRALAGARPVVFTVSGLIPQQSVGVDSSVAFVDIATAQELFGRVGRLDRIDLVVAPAHLGAVARQLQHIVPPDARVVEPRVRTGEIENLLGSFRLNLAALGYIALVVGMFLIYNTVAISVVQRKAEIGTARALGARRSQIFAVFLGEGALFGVAGALAGLLLGALLARFSVAAVAQTVSALFVGVHADHVLYTPVEAVRAFAVGVALALASAVVPALDAAATAPALAMRVGHGYEARVPRLSFVTAACGGALLVGAAIAARAPAIGGVPVFGFASGVLIVAGASLCVPLALSLAVRMLRASGARRWPAIDLALGALRASLRRFSVAIASLMIAVGMTVAIAVLIGSFRATVVAWANDTLAADLYISGAGPTDASYEGHIAPDAVAAIGRVAGVASVDTYRGFDVPFRGRSMQLGAANLHTPNMQRKLRFLGSVDVRALARRMPSGNYVVVSEPFVTRFGLRTGDSFTLQTPAGAQRFEIAGEYNDYSSSEGAAIMDYATFRRLFHDDSVDAVAVYARPGVNLAALRTAIERAVAPLAVNVRTNRELRAYVIVIFNQTFAITNALYVISIAIAVLGVVSTLFALVLERRTEIGVLRYIGLTVAGVRRMIFAEAVVVGALGGLLGIAVGFILSLLLIFVIDRQSFGWLIELHVPWAFFAQAFLGMTAAAAIAAIYPANVAARIKTAEAVRAE